MTRTFMLAGALALLASPSLADVKNGNANPTSFARYRFMTPGDGEVNITTVWTNRNANLHTLLICGATSGDNSFLVGQSFGNLDRIMHLTVGVPAEFSCTVLVKTFNGTSAFRLHVQHAAAESFSNAGSTPTLELSEGLAADTHEAIAQESHDRARSWGGR